MVRTTEATTAALVASTLATDEVLLTDYKCVPRRQEECFRGSLGVMPLGDVVRKSFVKDLVGMGKCCTFVGRFQD